MKSFLKFFAGIGLKVYEFTNNKVTFLFLCRLGNIERRNLLSIDASVN